jgi:MIP family channel proteins
MSDSVIEIHTPRNYNSIPSLEEPIYSHNNKLFKESIFECIGMYTFIVLSLGNVAIYSLYPEANVTWIGVSISWGFNLMFGILVANLQSPAHLNPAVSLSMYLLEKAITLKQLICLTLSQLLGAFLAALTVYSIYYNKLGDDDSFSGVFTTYKNPSITTVSAFFTEFLGTALLVGGIFMMIDNKFTNKHLPLFIGAWLSTLVVSFGYQTAFAWNPARDMGPRILSAIVGYASFSYIDYYWWVPLVGSYTGGLTGALFYKYVIKPLNTE